MHRDNAAAGYVIARRTLIKALEALAPLPRDSVVLVGAQAVYLRAPISIVAIPPYTFDGDLAVDPIKIERPRHIRDHLEAAGFFLRNSYGGFYSLARASPEESYASKIDILVPQGVAHRWEADGFNARDVSATNPQPGIEICLLDHSPMSLAQLDDDDRGPRVVVEVAGTVALLIAKGWKIGERFEQGAQAFQGVAKDIADVYRLLRASKARETRATLARLPPHEAAHVVLVGATYLNNICGRNKEGIALFRTIVGFGAEADIVVASLEVLVEEFYGIVVEWMQTAQS